MAESSVIPSIFDPNPLLSQISNTGLDEQVGIATYRKALLLLPDDRIRVLDAISCHNMQATITDQLPLPEIIQDFYSSPHAIEHRKQSGNHCGLESLHRAIQAVGLFPSANEVVRKGIELGYSDGSRLLFLLDVVEKLGIAPSQVVVEMLPENFSPVHIDPEQIRQAIIMSKLSAKRAVAQRTQIRPEVLVEKVIMWLDHLRDKQSLVLQVNDSYDFWCIPQELRSSANGVPHAVALVGYKTDEKNRLALEIYDPAFAQGPLFVGPKHLSENTAAHYLQVKKSTK